jgi:hypothetical protein
MHIRRGISVGLVVVILSMFVIPFGNVQGQTGDCLLRPAVAAGYMQCIRIERGGMTSFYSFNDSLYKDRGVAAYGGPSSIAVQENTFVERTKPDPLKPDTVPGGYYSLNGKSGEYRYHGFDAAGAKFENRWFPDDVYKNHPQQRTWIYRPWSNLNGIMNTALNKPLTPGLYASALQVTRRTISNGGLKGYQKLQDGLGWTPTSSYPSNYPVGLLYDYAVVHQKATTRNAGAASMWSYSAQSKKAWIQTFPIPKLIAGDKKMIPVAVTLNVTSADGEASPYSLLKSKDVNYKTFVVKVTATLGDQTYWSSTSLQDEYLNRSDLLNGYDAWKIKLYDGVGLLAGTENSSTVIEVNPATLQSEAKAITQFTLRLPASQIVSNTVTLRAEAEANFVTGEKGIGNGTTSVMFSANTVPSNYSSQSFITCDPNKPISVEPKPNIPSTAFDVVAMDVSDSTVMTNVASRSVSIDGVSVNASTFFSGNYSFGLDSQGNHLVAITYHAGDGSTYVFNKWVYVYDTKPRASFTLQGGFKMNRLISMVENSAVVNRSVVTAAYPITGYTYEFFNVDGDLASLRKSVDTNGSKKFLFKTKGTYGLRLRVTNALGRVSDPFEVKFNVRDDLAPTIIQHPFSAQLARGETVTFASSAGSPDGDGIRSFVHEVYWDSNQDNVAETSVYQATGEFLSYKPEKLGLYEVRSHAEEQFGEETDASLVTAAESKVVDGKTYFMVDNYAPAADLYFEQPNSRPKADVYFMLDANLRASSSDYIRNNLINIRNLLNEQRVDADVRKWDMRTYQYATPMATTKYTGTTFPDSQISYTSGGYTGTLQLYLVNYTTSSTDQGVYESKTDTKTVTDTCENRVTVYYDANGYYSSTSSTSACPTSKSYDDGKYKGTLDRTGATTSDPYCPSALYPYATCSRLWVASYSGTVSWTHQVWVSNWVTTTYYLGYYSGTGYQSVREQAGEAFSRLGADRYIIYISDNTISELSDFIAVKDKQDSNVVLSGNDAIITQSNYDHFVRAGPPIEQIVQEVIAYIVGQSSSGLLKTVLVNESFELNTAEYDMEQDQISSRKMMVIHDYNAVDNALGAYPSSVVARTELAWQPEQYPNAIRQPGLYTWIRKVRDFPTTSCIACDYGYDSNESQVQLFVHRKPIAAITLTHQFDAVNNRFQLTWTDESYDPDNQTRRADKGIAERQFRYRQVGGTVWVNERPNLLSTGIYEMEYLVKDVNGAWSEVYVFSLTLSAYGGGIYSLDAQVNHTPEWLAYHRARGEETQLPPKVFFAGEKLLLLAEVSAEPIDTVVAQTQLPTILGYSIPTIVEMRPSIQSLTTYVGELYEPYWASWQEPVVTGIYPVIFTAKYKNGTSKVMEVPIRIIGSVYESYGVQRLK